MLVAGWECCEAWACGALGCVARNGGSSLGGCDLQGALLDRQICDSYQV